MPGPREPQGVSGIEVLYPTEDNRPVFVGERTNVIGSRRFKELVAADRSRRRPRSAEPRYEAAPRCSTSAWPIPTATRPRTWTGSMTALTRKVKVLPMIDSTDADVIELALRHCQGKAIVNSINLEDGEERFQRVDRCRGASGRR